VYASGRPWSWLVGRFGVYTGDAGQDVAGNHGFGWELGNRAGYTFFSELGFPLPDDVPAGTYSLGGIYNTNGTAQFGDSGARTEHYELYGMFDQAVWRRDDGTPRLGLFAHLSGTPQKQNTVVGIYADGGAVLFGPVPSRPQDALGLAVSVLRFTSDFRNDTNGTLGGGETVLEVTYQINVAPWLVIQPDFQCFFNPSISRRDAQALGIQGVALF
jgi:carbohydrate-selective porin OprB